MSVIDVSKQVVQMVFDNGSFEKNASESLETIQKLKDALNFNGAVRGLENLKASASDFGMDLLSNGVYKVQEGFNALDVVATRVLQNITDKIQNIATDLAEKVTIEPLRAGLEEYETQINSVQTILANTNDALMEKGLTTEHERIEKINGVLDDLNHYADMTIYNFTEMTRNIGTFTAAGVDLDTAATSIKGIANLAAMSGSNSQQASTAMYQLSQAIAAGSVKLQDWNSVVNAGMGGKLFQNELIDTAKAMGVADEQFVALTQGATTFRESLSSGWISAEVLTNTLEKFTAGSEGYTKSQVEQMQQLWRARGYSEQQIQSLTGSIDQLTEEEEKNLRTKWAEKGFSDEQIDHILSMGTAATDAATKVKTFSQLLETVGEALQSGWTQSWEYIIGDFEQAKMLWTEVSDIMNLYIGKSADARNNVLKEWSRAAYSYNENGQLIKLTYDEAGNLIKDADEQIVEGGKMLREEMGGRELVIQSIRNTFQGLFEIAMEFGKAWDLGFWGKGTQNDISITAQKLKDLSLKLYDFTNNFKNAFQRDEMGKAVGLLGELRESFDKFAQTMRNAYSGIKDVFSGLGNILSSFFNSTFFSIDSLNTILNTFSRVVDVFSEFANVFKREIGPSEKNRQSLIYFFNGLQKAIEQFFTIKVDFITNMFEGLGLIFEHIIGPGQTVATILGDFGSKLLLVSNAIGSIFKNSDGSSKFKDMFTDIARGVNDFIDALKANVDFDSFTNMFSKIINILSNSNTKIFDTLKNIIESIFNLIKPIMGVLTPLFVEVSNFVVDILPKAIDFLYQLSERIKTFTESLIPSSDTISGLQTLFKGVFDILSAIGQLLGTIFLSLLDSLGEILRNLLPDGKEFGDILTTIGTKLTEFADKIKGAVNGKDGVPKLSELMGSATDKLVKFFEAFKNLNLLETFIGLLKRLGDGLKHALGGSEDMSLLDVIIEKIKGFLDRLKYLFSDESGNLDFVKIFETGGIGLLLKKLFEIFKNTTDLSDKFKNIADILNDFKDTVGDAINDLTAKFKAEAVKTLATSMIEIAAALFIIAAIDPVALGTAVATITAMFRCMERLLVVISAFKKETAANLMAAAQAIKAVGTAILEMSIAVKILGEMNPEDLVRGLLAVTGLVAGLVVVAEKLSGQENMMKGVGGLIALAFALDLLIIPVKVLGEMDFNSLVKGLGATIVLMGGLTGAAIALSKWGKDFKVSTAIGLILMAEGIKILADAVMEIKDISWEGLAKGLSVFAVGLGGMVGAAAIISNAHLKDDLLALGIALVALGAAMELLANGLTGISNLSWEDLAKGLAVFGVALVGLGVASYAINGANLLMIGGAIFLVATAISELAITLNVAQVLGPLCTSIAAGLNGIKDSLVGFANNAAASAFLDFIQNLLLFIPRLAVGLAQGIIDMIVTLGNGAAQIVDAVVKIGSAIIGGLRELLPQIFGLIKETLEQIFQLLIAETPRLFETLGVFFNQLWPFLQEQIPQLFATLGVFFEQLWPFLSEQIHGVFGVLTTFFTELFTFLQTEGPMLVETIRLMIDTVLQAIIEEAPVITETFLTLLQSLLTTINTAVPEITGTLLNLITTLLVQLAEFAPQMAQSAMEILLGFLNAIAENIGQITESAISIAIAFLDGLAQKMPELVDSAFKLVIEWIDGLARAIEENHNALFDAVGHLIKAIVEAILDGIVHIVDAAGRLLDGFFREFDAGKLAGDLFNIGANLVNGIIDGIVDFAGRLWDQVASLAQGAIDTLTSIFEEHSPSRVGKRIGGYLAEGVAIGVDEETDQAISSVGAMAYGVLDAMNVLDTTVSPTITPTLNASNMGAIEQHPTISPVVDDSDMSRGIDAINAIVTSLPEEITSNLTAQIDANNNVYHALEDIASNLISMRWTQDQMNSHFGYLLDSIANNTLESASKAMLGSDIYMDTGALVGAIAPEMDNALGLRQIYAERGMF